MYRSICAVFCLAWLLLFAAVASAAQRPNLLLITVDDMNADSVGVFGSTVPETTPHIDQLASIGFRFERAHVQVANCKPSRNVLWSGRYPANNRVEGFYRVSDPGYPTLADVLKEAGYFTAIRHKVPDSTPYYPYDWDLVLDETLAAGKGHKKDPESYGKSVLNGIRAAKVANKPFYLLINIADPHLPFYGLNRQGEAVDDAFIPSRVFTAQEVSVPGFLVDDPVIRQELAQYYSSVRRADDAVGSVMSALQASGQADNTIVMFLSDHGMPFPFAKTQLYHHSTLTPLLFRWPGITAADAVDSTNMVSAVDIMPTLLDGLGIAAPAGIDGHSFLPLLKGKPQEGRDQVFKAYGENSSGLRTPMRALETPRFLYVFNPWSDGQRAMFSATMTSKTYRRMQELAKRDEGLAARMKLLEFRVLEELYDLEVDPDCLVNLVDEPRYKAELNKLRAAMEGSMLESGDPMLEAFRNRQNPQVLAAYMQQQELASKERKRQSRERKRVAREQAIIEELRRREAESSRHTDGG